MGQKLASALNQKMVTVLHPCKRTGLGRRVAPATGHADNKWRSPAAKMVVQRAETKRLKKGTKVMMAFSSTRLLAPETPVLPQPKQPEKHHWRRERNAPAMTSREQMMKSCSGSGSTGCPAAAATRPANCCVTMLMHLSNMGLANSSKA